MYDERDNDHIENSGFNTEPNPDERAEDIREEGGYNSYYTHTGDDAGVQDGDMASESQEAEPLHMAEVAEEATAVPVAEETPDTTNPNQNQQQSGFYHYSYDRSDRNQSGRTDYQEYRQTGSFYDQPELPKKEGRLFSKFVMCAGLAVVFGVVASAAFQITDYVGGKITPTETEARIEKAEITAAETEISLQAETNSGVTPASTGSDVSQVAENTMPSIVAITNKGVEEVQSLFYGQSYKQETESAGSGVIIAQSDTELLIATNNHVVDGAEELTICFTVEADDPESIVVEAQVKGTDPDHDLAVVAVDLADIADDVKSKIKVVQIGDSENLKVGQQVVAIGNALGYGQSVTVGYISALDREVTVDNVTNNLIQTDAAINFGNSGGALLNSSGQLIGINSVKAAASGVEGMGYAIPMKTAEPILNDLMNQTTRSKVDETEKGYMGITPVDVSEEARQVYDMPAGAFVYQVSEGSAAAEAGIVKGDIIVKIDGVSVSSQSELLSRMNYYKVGETVEVVVATAEGGEYKERTVSITLGERPADADTQETQAEEGQQPNGGEYGEDGEMMPYGDGFQDGYSDEDGEVFQFPR